ncbi:MAG: hypothetical protein IKF96_02620 [Eggerthellaceae bacterium]|nr:hypothetical protein [Eggerthellaceae bacterium]
MRMKAFPALGMKAKVLIALASAALACSLAPAVAFADHFNDYLVTEGEFCQLGLGSSTVVDGEFEPILLEGRPPAGLEFSTVIEDGNIRLLLSGTPERPGSFTFQMDWTDSKYHITVDHYTIRVTVLPTPVLLNDQRSFPA